MKKKNTPNGMMMLGRHPKAGVTNYLRNGDVVSRVSKSQEKRSNKILQFDQRQRHRHSIALWHAITWCKPMFTQNNTNYNGFVSYADRLPVVVYVPKTGPGSDASFLLPDIPVSDGTLPVVKQRLGDSALLTNLKAAELKQGEELWLYTAEQLTDGRSPQVRFNKREVALSEMTEVEGCLALTGAEFDDEMKGWALVRVNGDRCSSQALVTRCTYYQRFTTDEALQTAAKSYGGLTD